MSRSTWTAKGGVVMSWPSTCHLKRRTSSSRRSKVCQCVWAKEINNSGELRRLFGEDCLEEEMWITLSLIFHIQRPVTKIGARSLVIGQPPQWPWPMTKAKTVEDANWISLLILGRGDNTDEQLKGCKYIAWVSVISPHFLRAHVWETILARNLRRSRWNLEQFGDYACF